MQLRQTAHKLWVQNIIESPFVEQQGEWEPNFIDFQNKKISRVNIIATIVDHFVSPDNNYSTIVVDDSSATIRARVFKEDVPMFKDLKIGDAVMIVGRTKKYNDEVYILPEIIKKLDNPNWEVLRKFELIKGIGRPRQVQYSAEDKFAYEEPKEAEQLRDTPENQVVTEEYIEDTSSSRQKVLSFIEKMEEASVKEISEDSGMADENINIILKELLKEGEIYQPKPGYFRIV